MKGASLLVMFSIAWGLMADFHASPVELRLPVGALFLSCWLTGLLTAADSPNDRQPTDPKSLSSLSNSSARGVPIEDFFYSRRVSSPAWSPTENALCLPP